MEYAPGASFPRGWVSQLAYNHHGVLRISRFDGFLESGYTDRTYNKL